jgi:fucose permease
VDQKELKSSHHHHRAAHGGPVMVVTCSFWEVCMPQDFVRSRFTWLAYLMIAFYGYYINILGPITPFLKDELNLNYTISSLHFTAFAVGILLMGLSGHLVIMRLGRRRSLWLGAFGMGLSALVLIAGQTPVITIGASFVMGWVGSLILTIVPSALSDAHTELRAVAISEANVVSSIVAAIAPLLVGWFGHVPGGWRIAMGIGVLIPIFMFLGFRKTLPPPATASNRPTAKNNTPLPLRFWVYWIAVVLAVAIEFCMISWSADYFEVGKGLAKTDAAQTVSLFLGAMIFGRLAGSRLVHRFSTARLLVVTILIAGVGFGLFWKGGSLALNLSGLFLTGLGVASMYPFILSLALGTATSQAVQASSRTTLASGVAILTLPLVLGRLADAVGIELAYGVVIVLLIGVFGILQVANHMSSGPAPAANAVIES